jgi:hypothetical protein
MPHEFDDAAWALSPRWRSGERLDGSAGIARSIAVSARALQLKREARHLLGGVSGRRAQSTGQWRSIASLRPELTQTVEKTLPARLNAVIVHDCTSIIWKTIGSWLLWLRQLRQRCRCDRDAALKERLQVAG